jgi:hypothetical protein
MKKIIYLFATTALFFVSCKKDDAAVETPTTTYILPKKLTNTDVSGGSETITFTYDGNKLLQLTSGVFKMVWTYTGNLVTKNETYSNGVRVDESNVFTYENDKLKTVLNTYESTSNGQITINKRKTNFTYNSDGTITEQYYSVDNVTGTETLLNSPTTITFANGNIAKSTNTQIYTASDSYKSIYDYEFDTKNAPFKNVLGFNKLIDQDFFSNVNNTIKETNTSINTSNGIPTTYTSFTVNEYKYNADNYPIEVKYYNTNGALQTTSVITY